MQKTSQKHKYSKLNSQETIINLSNLKTKKEKEQLLFKHKNPLLENHRKPQPDTKKESTCFCLGQKYDGPKPNADFNFSQTSEPNYKLEKVLFIYNPFSGNGRGKGNIKIIEQCLEEAKIKVYHTLATQRRNHGYEFALDDPIIDQVDMVLVTGGDGTLKEVLNGLIKRAKKQGLNKVKPIGYVPGGTGNCLGLTLYGEQNRYDVKKVMQHIIHGKPYFMDALQVEYLNSNTQKREIEYAHFQASWGLGEKANTTSESLRFLGPTRYNVATLYEIMKGCIQKVTIQVDDGQEYEMDSNLIMTVSDKYVGDKLNIAPFAQIDDGYLDVIIFDKAGRFDTLDHFGGVQRNGAHVYNDSVLYGQCKKLKINTPNPTIVQLDGEGDLHQQTPLEIQVLSKYVQIIH